MTVQVLIVAQKIGYVSPRRDTSGMIEARGVRDT